MNDYYLKAKSGNRKAVKGVYASSLLSAYESVSRIVKDEKTACNIIKESYYYAFSVAESEDEFYKILNSKTENECKFYSQNAEKMQKIVPINTYYADIKSMNIPQELKDYSTALSEIVAVCRFDEKESSVSQKSNTQENKDFKDFSEFSIKKDEPQSAEDKLTDILKRQPDFVSTQEKIIEKKEKKKDKKHLIVSLILAVLIIAGGISAYVVSRWVKSESPKTTSAKITASTTTTKIYPADQGTTAFKDYLNNIIIPRNGIATSEKTVAYDDGGAVGIGYLNGVVSAKIFDFDKDGEDELAVVLLTSYQTKNSGETAFIYDYNLSLYDFENGKVVPNFENYFLMEYKTFNRIGSYSNNNFKFFIRMFYKKNIPYIYVEASGTNYSMVSYSSYYGEKMHDGKTFLHYAFNDESFIYLQKSNDGTYVPQYFIYRNYPINDASKGNSEMITELKNAGINLSGNSVSFTSSEKFKANFNSEFKETGLQLGLSNALTFATEKKKDYLVSLESKVEKLGELQWNTVVSVKDYTGKNKLIKN